MRFGWKNLIACLLVAAAIPAVGLADSFPSKSVRIIVPFAAGGTPDVVARAVAQQLAIDWKQSVYIENRAGANGTLGAKLVAQSDPDGYTLLYTTPGIASTPFIFKNPPFDLFADLVPIATSGVVDGYFMLTNPKLPVHNIHEFIDYAKTNRVIYGSPGVGNPVHLTTEIFALKAGIKMEHLPFKGSPEALTTLLGGDIQLLLVAPPPVLPLIANGTVRAIGFTGSHPFAAAPDVPLAINEVSGFPPSGSWGMFFAAAKTPPGLVDKLNADIIRALATPAVVNIVEKAGYERDNRSAAETAAFLRREVDMAGAAIRAAAIQPH